MQPAYTEVIPLTLHTITGELTPTPPFDFAKSLNFLGTFPPTQQDQSLAVATLTKALTLEGRAIIFQVRDIGTVAEPRLAYTLHTAQPLTEATHAAVADRIRFFLSMEDNLRPFYEIAHTDDAFAPIVEKLYGYHQVKFLTPFENICWAILTQRNRMAIARETKHRLTEAFGSSLTLEGDTYHAFPEAHTLAAISLEQLQDVVRHEQKTDYLHAAAQAFSAVDEAFLRSAPYQDVEAWLKDIKGIGPWSAEFVLVRGLGRMEQAPASERKLFAAAEKIYSPDEPLTKPVFRRIARRYGEYQGYWAHYLRVAT